MRLLAEIEFNPTQERVAPPTISPCPEDGVQGTLGPKGGEFTVQLPLTGHGLTTAGALVQKDIATLLGIVIGGVDSSDSGSTVSGVTDAGQFTSAATFADGSLLRVGVPGDGRGEGQFAAVDDGTLISLLTDLPAAPNVGDVIYAAQQVYPLDCDANWAAITSTRWLIQTRDGQYKVRGAWPQSLTINGLQVGEQPSLSITFGFAFWEPTNQAFPPASSPQTFEQSTVARGSVFIANLGDQTRVNRCIRSLSFALETQSISSMCGVNDNQIVVDACRTRMGISELSMVFDSEAAGTNTWYDLLQNGPLQHILLTFVPVDGKAIGMYLPKVELTSVQPMQSVDGLNRIGTTWRVMSGDDQTTSLTASNFRIALG